MDKEADKATWRYDSQNDELAAEPTDSETLQWTASEYVAHQKTIGWYLVFGGGSVLLALVIYFATRSLFSSFVVIIACVCIAVFGARQPRQIPYEIGYRGIKVADRVFPYSQFKSFSLVPEGAIYTIWLRSLKKFMPTVALYFAPEDAEKIIEALSHYLPHEDRQPDAIDRATQRFRF